MEKLLVALTKLDEIKDEPVLLQFRTFCKQHNIKTLFIDVTNADFLGDTGHLQIIIDALDKEYNDGQHYIALP